MRATQLKADNWRDAALLGVAAAGLGYAIQVRDGLYEPWGLVGLALAIVATLLIFIPVTIPQLDRVEGKHATWVFAAAIGFNFLQWFTPHRLPGSEHGTSATPLFYGGLGIALLLSAVIVFQPCFARPALIALVVVFCVLGTLIIRRVPTPYMDVWMLQTEGLKAFVHGHNPFGTPFVDIYHRPELYGPAAKSADGLIHLGFPYPPMVLWLELPGYLIGGDYRWSNLAAMAATALLIAFMSRNRLAPLAAALFLFTPRALFVLESGWTEPITALLLAATVFCAVRLPRTMPILLGLFLCSKQYLIWAIPPIFLLTDRPSRLVKTLAIAFIAGAVASLPLILWDVKAYLAANVDVANGAGFRMDALSYLALWANVTKIIPTAGVATAIGFGAAASATALVCLRGKRTPAGYAAAVAMAHVAFFAFYKFAFCNYDWFLIAAFCCAAGALRPFEEQSTLQADDYDSISAMRARSSSN
jgi:hypothetical protein